MPALLRTALALTLVLVTASLRADSVFESEIRPLLKKYCVDCHGGDDVNGEVDFTTIRGDADLRDHFEVWESVAQLVSEGVMPPEDEPQPSAAEKARLRKWYEDQFIHSVEAHPGYFRPRRLSAHEYRNTLHSVFGFPLEVAIIEAEQTVAEKSLVMKLLPTDPPGESGFKNDTSGNPLTNVVWDQYSYLVDFAIERLFSTTEKGTIESIVGAIDDERLSREQSKLLLQTIAARAFRRTNVDDVLTRSIAALNVARVEELQQTTRRELKTILMSPRFFYRGLMMEAPRDRLTPVDDFELAERLSYFLWADMPDEELTQLAASGKLRDQAVFDRQIERMLTSSKSRSLAETLGVEWFSLDEIDNASNNPPFRDALKSQPIDFLHYLFREGRPILELIDSKTAFVNSHTAKYYPGDRRQLKPYRKTKGIEVEKLPNQRISLEESNHRGGLLTMPGVLAMNRGPVLRGTWMLERVLGEELPEPPADVGQVPANKRGEKLSFRQRFELHRNNPTCAVCHDKIDPLGFSLGFYNDSGVHVKIETPKVKKGKQPEADPAAIDASGSLPSGETFANFQELKRILVTGQKEPIIRNVVERFMAYALCRKLEYYDRPEVDRITAKMLESGTFRDLIHEICNSLPMRQTVVQGE